MLINKLTGVHNKIAFDIMVDTSLKEFQRSKFPFLLILFDMDHFKQVNDKYGHFYGVLMIKKVSQ